ncbi:aldo/keto reductase [Candidatus Nomurabacteria bacterium]|uniref:Aldo/keto reductase n=1 Tax=Candidatus Dojkabacteria bacterium TaxID=2099670 RepID=A0A955I9W2_9BACT|nr:aldo/keto reductase [Candidatus Dojkabacteria bacterium]MCB9790197.1 aldo/keto reductase [Candidatus Nomurabacteria bacterium]MCB9803283.1 aldo/keto reductase [Candidatus Nomurabacteria bacterium]
MKTSDKLIIGTWGLSSAGWHKKDMSKDQLYKLFDKIIDYGLREIDTAQVYGQLEDVIGLYPKRNQLLINTKIPSLSRFSVTDQVTNIDEYYPINYLEKAVDKSLNSLKVNIINTLYLHNWHKSFNFEGSGILELIEKLKREGKLLKFGISLPDNYNTSSTKDFPVVDELMVPYNHMNSWAKEIVVKLPTQPFILRSIFLQGLLLKNINDLAIDDMRLIRNSDYKLIERKNIGNKFLRNFLEENIEVLSNKRIKILIGVSNNHQLQNNLDQIRSFNERK